MSDTVNELLDELVNNLYLESTNRITKVLDVFNDFFGEDRVDIQGRKSLEEFKDIVKEEFIYDSTINYRRSEYFNNKVLELPEPVAVEIIKYVLDHEKTQISLMNHICSDIFILVHFPKVRITNEHDRYVDITHLYAKIPLTYYGQLDGSNFMLNRSEYPVSHMLSNYMHSHVSAIPKYNFTQFMSPCLGNGPIRNTLCALRNGYDEDLWRLFCLELSKYVTIESLSGGPYHMLESIGFSEDHAEYTIYNRLPGNISERFNSLIIAFVKHFINCKKLKFNYVNGSYSVGMTTTEYIILVSNEFINWYNRQYNEGYNVYSYSDLLNSNLLTKVYIINNRIYENTNSIEDMSEYIGREVCTFKGKDVTINIIGISDEDRNKCTLLSYSLALYILKTILDIVNYKYGRASATENTQNGTKIRYV